MDLQLVSLIIPCYNGEKYLDKCFQSIYNQTYSKLEVVVVNDGSTDGTEQIFNRWKIKLKSKGIIVKYIYKENRGVCSAINAGLKVFTGEFLKWLDCDDWMETDCIEKEIEFFNSHPNYGAVRSLVAVVLEDDEKKVNGFLLDKYQNEEYIFDLLVDEKITVYPPIGWCVRSSAFINTHSDMRIYEENRGGQNYQMLLPIACKYKVGYINKLLSYYLVRKDSLSHDKTKAISNSYMHQKNCEMALRTCEINDIESYIQRINYRFTKSRFEYAVNYCDKDVINRTFKEMKKINRATLKTYFFLLNRFKIIRFFKRLIALIRRKIKIHK